jgi:hypothetical protein
MSDATPVPVVAERPAPYVRERVPLRALLRPLSASVGLGLLLAAFLYFLQPKFFGLRVFGHGALIGLLIFFACFAAEWLLESWLARRSRGARLIGRGLMYFVAANVGWFSATWIARELALVHPKVFSAGAKLVLINGILAVPLAFAFYGYGVLKERLQQSAIRLKEAEFAEKELELARAIQKRLLPAPELEEPAFRLAARNGPARWVAGDFYDVFRLADGGLGIAVADVVGKGMGASLIMASVKAVLPFVAAAVPASEALRRLNAKLSGELAPREFVALTFARYDPATGEVELSNAGLPDPYLISPGKPPSALSVPGPRFPLGARPSTAYESLRLTLAAGDRILFLTDGMPEAPDPRGEPLGYEAFAAMLPPLSSGEPGGGLDGLFARVQSATQETREDDWTALLLEHRRNP